MKTNRILTRCVLFILILLTATGPALAQGSITPPDEAFKDGNPTRSMKTLNEVEPRVIITNLPIAITNSGAYYLVSSLQGTNGIYIDSDDVTIDFNGFGISGDTNHTTHGIEMGPDVLHCTIKNGRIGDWGGWGIYAETNGDFFVISDLMLELNGLGGINLGPHCRLKNVTVSETGGDGINLRDAATIKDTKATGNNGNGIVVGQGSTVEGCNASQNKQDGVNAEIYSTIRDCTAVFNEDDGIQVHASTRVLNNNIGNSMAAGIHATGPGNRIINNNITANNKGIQVEGQSNWIEDNSVIDNAWGIEVTGVGNLVIRNGLGTPLATNGVHFNIGPSNQVGEIIQSLEQNLTNSNPWANIRLTVE